MPQYQITGPDGTLYSIDGPAGASREQIISAIQKQQQLQQFKQPEEDPYAKRLKELEAERTELMRPKPTIGGNIKEAFKGVVPGAIGLGETAATGIAALLPDDTEKAAREKIKEYAGIAKKPFEAAPGYEDSVGRNIGQGLGSTLPFFALGPLGVAGRVAGAGLGVAAGAGEAREAAEAKGATPEERRRATQLGAPTGILDIIAPEIKPFRSLMVTAAARGGVEGATEAAQKIAQNLIAKGVYNPNQEILIGSGEEGAYGAGVGALASLIVDMTIGRKARAAHLAEKYPAPPTAPAAPTTETQQPQGTQLLGYDQVPFTPVSMPDGSVITNRADYEAYQQGKEGQARQRQEDLRTSDPLAGLSEFDQRLARSGKQAALQETFEQAQPDLFGDILPERSSTPSQVDEIAAPVRDERQGELPLTGGRTIEQQIIELIVGDKNKQQVDKAKEQRAQEEAAAAKASGTERLKFESDLTSVSGQLDTQQQKESEQNRLMVLLPIIDNPQVKNIGPAFQAELRRQGFNDTNLTEREQSLIDKVNDFRAATPAEKEAAPAAPAENATMESAIPEKSTTREPEQLGIPGIGKRTAPQVEEAPVAEKPFDTVLTADVLDKSGLPRQSGFYRQLLNKDMGDPAQQGDVAQVLTAVRNNKAVSPATKQAVERVAMQAFGGLATQGEMFGPRGGVLAPVKESKNAPSGNAKSDTTATGTSTPNNRPDVSVDRPAASTTRAEAPKTSGLVDTGKPAGSTATGKAAQPAPLTSKGKPSDTSTAPPATTTVTKEGKAPAAARTTKKVETKTEGKPEGKKTTTNITTPKTEGKPEGKKTESSPKATETGPKTTKNTADYAMYDALAQENFDKAIDFLAADMYNAMYPQKDASRVLNEINSQLIAGQIPTPKFGKEGAFVTGMGGKHAKAFFDSLTADGKEALRKRLEYYFITWENRTSNALNQINANQAMARNTAEQVKEGEEDGQALTRDAMIMTRPLHPAILDALKEGNIIGALRILANQDFGRPSRVAQRLSEVLGSTKVKFVSSLKNSAGEELAGQYDPKTDTITLNSNAPLGVHTLLHEVVHAATSHVLDNKSHPLTKQLTELYNNVKGSLDTAYGAQSLEEFVAEAFSNPEFQSKLEAINPKGEAISAWERFFNAVRNFVRGLVGLDSKPIGSALDASDMLINHILSPAPDSRSGDILSSAALHGTASKLFDNLGDRYRNLPVINDEWKGRIHEFFTGAAPNSVKNVVRGALPLNALVEVAQKYIPMAGKLDTLVGERSGLENARNQSIEPIVDRVEKWASSNKDKLDDFNNVVYTSTLEQVDPSKPRATYAKDVEKLKAWDSLHPKWTALGESGQSVYNQMRDTYKKMYEQVKGVLDARIDSAIEDKPTANKIKTEVYQRLFQSGHIEPYFPLTRTGKYWLSYNAIDPRNGNKEFYVEAYETSYARDEAIKELNADPAAKAEDVQKFANPSQINYRRAPATSFVNSILRTLEVNKVNSEVTEEVMRLFLDTLPETSFAQSFRHRKGTLGFDRHDAIGALRMKTYSLSRQLSNMEYGQKFEQLRAEIKDYVRSQGNPETAVQYMDELNQRIDFAISPSVPTWSKLATSFGFNMTLGFNVSSAIVNMAQVPLVVMPYLGGKYGYGVTSVALGRAARIFTGSGFDREVEMLVPTDKGEKSVKVRAFPSIDNYDFSKNTELKHLETLVKVAQSRGQLNRSQMYDVLDVGEDNNLLTKVNAASGFIFHHGERMNRQVSLVAAYELELNQMRKDGKTIDAKAEQEAAEYALYVTELTNGGTTAAAAPRLAQSPLGKIVFMYKRYGAAMYYMLFKTARDALKHQDPKVRKAAMKQIAGIYGSAALMAGIQGLPMFGVAAMVYNIFKGDDDDDLKTATRKWTNETMYSGLGNAVFGLDVASRWGLSDLLFRDTIVKDQQSAVLSLMEQAGGPVLGVASKIERGLKLINDGHTERGIEQMLPSAIGNAMKSIRFANEGANTLRGDPITGEIGPWNSFAQFFGFAPAEYTRQLEINAAEKGLERKWVEERTKLLRNYYIALRNGDGEEANDLMKKMSEFNDKHMSKSPAAVITAKTIKNSMAQHMKTTSEMYHGVTLNKMFRPELLQNASEYDEQ